MSQKHIVIQKIIKNIDRIDKSCIDLQNEEKCIIIKNKCDEIDFLFCEDKITIKTSEFAIDIPHKLQKEYKNIKRAFFILKILNKLGVYKKIIKIILSIVK